MKELHLQHDLGIVTPSHLFSILHRHLHVTGGAILVPEPARDAFSPMATVGLDSTSKFRLRIPETVLRKLCTQSSALLLKGDTLAQLRPYLSVAEFTRLSRVAVFPFFYNREILAVLLIFDSPLLDLDLDVLDVLLAAFSERAGYLLFDGRHKPFSATRRASVLEKAHLAPVLSRLMDRHNGDTAKIVLLEISLGAVYEQIQLSHSHLDQAYLLRDLLETCALLCDEYYTVLYSGGAEFFLTGNTNPDLDSELLVHLLGNTLQQLFGIPSTTSPLQFSALDPLQFIREN